MKLLKELCAIHAPSGEEYRIKEYLLKYIAENSKDWKVQPEIIENGFQDGFILKFGKPRTAIYAHMDSIGFMVRYLDQLIPIGGPDVKDGYKLVGEDRWGPIECVLELTQDDTLRYNFARGIETGTSLVFKNEFVETEDAVQCCYLDNRLGVYNALKVAEDLEDGAIVFTCYEEHGGGSAGMLADYLYREEGVSQALISDITWVTDGVGFGDGVAISVRDRFIPRRKYIDRIIDIAKTSGVKYQLEVESSGGSDGSELQKSHLPIDWCFIGAPEVNVHSPEEKVAKSDIQSMIDIYKVLMKEL
ncbi:M20/M25/M40 family metallo-hydrolase [Aureibacter tunicatorum]|uniref:Aminopeptidase FrvX n=1 Tax=Aureibacter tunicatorum TaxID=866807 RepID=A0AAE3XQT7_9BACT|nr:M20/M25/M40 family metallo-hydrolase [Aureibacter tunicatorum]MDR6240226.1 putative aminopeptidase FrvX [Aureibacter tunicatorum]BDD05893.1 hypothetical protein AUTU_33760 [Aureibacter tunicatorum]